MTSEKQIERYLKIKVEQLGGLCLKFVSPGTRGAPDRIVILEGDVQFIELKRPGANPRPDQVKMIQRLKDRGATVQVLDSKKAVDEWLKIILQKQR